MILNLTRSVLTCGVATLTHQDVAGVPVEGDEDLVFGEGVKGVRSVVH